MGCPCSLRLRQKDTASAPDPESFLVKTREVSGGSPGPCAKAHIFAARTPQNSARNLSSRGAGTELFTGGMLHIGVMKGIRQQREEPQ